MQMVTAYLYLFFTPGYIKKQISQTLKILQTFWLHIIVLNRYLWI